MKQFNSIPPKILHTGDIHIFRHKRHEEIILLTQQLVELLVKEKVDLVYIGGDVIDSKANLSPEQIKTATYFFYKISEVCPIIVIPGNHDMNLKSEGSLDSLTPIIENLNPIHPVYYLKDSGIYNLYNLNWAIWSCIDNLNPFDVNPDYNPDQITIGCFHGAISGCLTDSNWQLGDSYHTIDMFHLCTNAFLADIHKRQYFRNEEIAYCGSIYQVKIDEEESKGVLIWEFNEKLNKYVSSYHQLETGYGFVTISISDLELFDISIVENIVPRKTIRLLYAGDSSTFSAIKFSEIARKIRYKYSRSVILQKQKEKINKKIEQIDSLKKEDYFNKYFTSQNIKPEVIQELQNLDEHYNKIIDNSEYQTGEYFIEEVEISNFLPFGEHNVINFTSKPGLIGLFANNKVGKSSVLSAIMFALFNKTTKNNKSLISLINDQQPKGTKAYVQVKLIINGVRWRIKRTINPNKKTSQVILEVYEEIDGVEVPRHDESRIQTDTKVLRKLLGDEKIFLTTVLCDLSNYDAFSKLTNSERLDLIIKFLGLGLYEQKLELCDKDLKTINSTLDLLKQEISKLPNIEELNEKNERLQKEREQIIIEKKSIINILDTIERDIEQINKELIEIGNIPIHLNEEEIKSQIANLNNSIQIKENKITEINQTIKQLSLYKTLDLTSEYNNIEKQQEKLRDTKNKLANINAQLESEICPTCKQKRKEIDKDKLLENKQEYELLINQLTNNINNQKKQLDQNYSKQKELFYAENQKQQLENDLQIINHQLENLTSDLQRIENNKDKLIQKDKLNKILLEKKQQLKVHRQSFEEINNKLILIETELGKLSMQTELVKTKSIEIYEQEQKFKKYMLYKKAMHRTGIPTLILAANIPEINNLVNSQITELYDINVDFCLTDNNLDINFYYDDLLNEENGIRDISQASGMESTIINLAIRAALTKISLLPKPSLLMLDEIFNTLDKESLELIQTYLIKLEKQYQNIIIVSHLEEIKEIPTHHIILKKENGITSVEEKK
jgi:DNA repair exonuclease SbcCD ATPase subunit/DNA repair exonuclease SbcCD nuclease subunit